MGYLVLHPPETNIAPENGRLECYIFSFWEGPFLGAMLVLGRVFHPVSLPETTVGIKSLPEITGSSEHIQQPNLSNRDSL